MEEEDDDYEFVEKLFRSLDIAIEALTRKTTDNKFILPFTQT